MSTAQALQCPGVAQRTGWRRVPNVAIFATKKRLAPPAYDEGFNRLYHVPSNERGQFIVKPCRKTRKPRTAQ